MAKAKVVHSQDACMIVFEGNPKHPEPTSGMIEFPGGCVEVSRTSDDTYWVHLRVWDAKNIVGSRIDYNHTGYTLTDGSIPNIPEAEHIEHLAIRVAPLVREDPR